MDKVFIEGLALEAVIGVYEWERTIRQRLVFDVEMDYDCGPAALDDDLARALDYSAVTATIERLVCASSDQLIETLAERVARALLSEFEIASVRLRLSKPGAVSGARNVGIEIVRAKVDSEKQQR